jgi:hypothetical protein
MKLFKIILVCILLIGCEKEIIQIDTPKISKKYQYEVKRTTKKNPKKYRMGKRTFCISKILKRKK